MTPTLRRRCYNRRWRLDSAPAAQPPDSEAEPTDLKLRRISRGDSSPAPFSKRARRALLFVQRASGAALRTVRDATLSRLRNRRPLGGLPLRAMRLRAHRRGALNDKPGGHRSSAPAPWHRHRRRGSGALGPGAPAVVVPFTTMLLVSTALTVVVNLLLRFFRR